MDRKSKIQLLKGLYTGSVKLSTIKSDAFSMMDLSKLTMEEINEGLKRLGDFRSLKGASAPVDQSDLSPDDRAFLDQMKKAIENRPLNYGQHQDYTQPFQCVPFETLYYAKYGKQYEQPVFNYNKK